jgi:hypothetical protein
MLKSESEAWNFSLMILIIFLHNMFRLVVGNLLLPTTLLISTHMNHVHTALILIIVLVIVHLGDNCPIFYNPDWSNHPDFSWQAQVMGNCAPQFHELHHPEYPQFKNQVLRPSSYDHYP